MANFFTLKKVDPLINLPVGLQADEYEAKYTNNTGIINVIEDLRFTGNDITGYIKEKVPYCILKEYELLTNSSINSLLYILQGTTGGNAVDYLNSTLNSLGETVTKFAPGTVNNLQAGAKVATPQKIQDFISTAVDVVKQEFNQLSTKKQQLPGSLKPYQGLYIRQETEFKYILPYFNDNKKTINTSFETAGEGGGYAGAAAKKVTEFAEKIVQTALITTPGAYIEQPKFFNMGDGPSYDFRFNLINTFDVEDIQKHYDFLFLLTFQNLPYRKDLARVRLPKIYSFVIPGEIFLPYAYIKSMTINFLGNRRNVAVTHPNGDTVKTIIPDVYEVNLTVTGLNPDVGNFMVTDYLTKIKSRILTSDEPFATPQAAANTVGPGTPRPLILPNPIIPSSPTIIPGPSPLP